MKYESNKGEGKLPFKTWAGVEVRENENERVIRKEKERKLP